MNKSLTLSVLIALVLVVASVSVSPRILFESHPLLLGQGYGPSHESLRKLHLFRSSYY